MFLSSPKKNIKLAYLTTKYPSVSHTFIRRELLELERRGYDVLRLAIRKSDATLVEPSDKEEAKKTIHCLNQPAWVHLLSFAYIIFASPIRFYRTLIAAIKMGYLSDRGVLKHFAYIVEACTLLRILRKYNIQHVHVHFGTNPSSVARLIYYLGGPTYSITVHGPTEFFSAIGFDLPGKIADALFIIAITDFCSAQLCYLSDPIHWHKIHVLRCNVGNDFFDAATPINENSKIFVCVGRLTPQKGQLVLLNAFAQLIASGYEAKLILVGDGELRTQLEDKIKQANLNDAVTITGFVSEQAVRKHIAASRTLVLPSFAEGLPVVIMESFAVGRPVISTYVAGIPELIKPGKNGWLVPANNVKDLTEALINVLETPVKVLSKMASHGQSLTYKNHHTTTEGNVFEKLLIKYVFTK